jgi:hypothetical protein
MVLLFIGEQYVPDLLENPWSQLVLTLPVFVWVGRSCDVQREELRLHCEGGVPELRCIPVACAVGTPTLGTARRPLAQEAVDDLGGPPPLGYLAMVTILSTNWPDSWSSTSANSQGVSIVKQALPVPRPNVSV